MAARHKFTQLYTSPTAIRAIQKHGPNSPNAYDLSHLRVIGSVGEPINASEWYWYFETVGKGRIPIVDTYWQTETGGIIISPLPGITPLKPGSCSYPLPGVEPVLIDPHTQKELCLSGKGVLCLRNPLPGLYYTGDGAYIDSDEYHFLTGRIDDVLSISGHRIGTAEIEAAITLHTSVAECAVISFPDNIKGHRWLAFCIPKCDETVITQKEILMSVRENVGPFAAIGNVLIVHDLPKTRSGKVMRRMLRKVVAGEMEELGDTSTLTNPSIISDISTKLHKSSVWKDKSKKRKLDQRV